MCGRRDQLNSIRLLYCIQQRLNFSPKILHFPLLLYSTLRHSPSSYSALLSSTLLPSVLLYYILIYFTLFFESPHLRSF